jgi:hypothetical protein
LEALGWVESKLFGATARCTSADKLFGAWRWKLDPATLLRVSDGVDALDGSSSERLERVKDPE